MHDQFRRGDDLSGTYAPTNQWALDRDFDFLDMTPWVDLKRMNADRPDVRREAMLEPLSEHGLI